MRGAHSFPLCIRRLTFCLSLFAATVVKGYVYACGFMDWAQALEVLALKESDPIARLPAANSLAVACHISKAPSAAHGHSGSHDRKLPGVRSLPETGALRPLVQYIASWPEGEAMSELFRVFCHHCSIESRHFYVSSLVSKRYRLSRRRYQKRRGQRSFVLKSGHSCSSTGMPCDR